MVSHRSGATPSEAFEARATTSYYDTVYPEGGYRDTPADGCIVPVCVFNDELELIRIVVHPARGWTVPP